MLKPVFISILLACFILSSGCARFGKGHTSHNKGGAKVVIAPNRL